MVVRLLSALTGILLLAFLAVGQESTNPHRTGSSTSQANGKSNPNGQRAFKGRPDSKDPWPGDGVRSAANSSDETVGWDPVTDRPFAHEIIGWFLFGLLISAPIFLVTRRLKTRKNESKLVRRILE